MSKAISIVALMAATIARGQTLTLDDVVARAIAHSPELRALEAGVAEARANAALGDAFHPAASVSTTPGYATGLPTAVLGQVPAIATLEAHRLLYDTSARVEQLSTAAQVDAATARLDLRRREVAQIAVDLYARVAADAALAASADRRVAAHEIIAARTEALRGEGRVRNLDADRTALQAASAKRAALQMRSRLDLDRLRLSRLVGQPLESIPAAVTPDVAMPLPSDSLAKGEANDPELHGLVSRIEALQRAAGLADRLWQPSVAAQIQYSRVFDRFRRYYLNFKLPRSFRASWRSATGVAWRSSSPCERQRQSSGTRKRRANWRRKGAPWRRRACA
jgi:outer membrane protein TolC